MLLTDTGGLYTADPRRRPRRDAGRRGRRTPRRSRELEIGHAASPLGSGGMRSKVVAAEMATAAGIRDGDRVGLEPGVLGRGLGGRARRHALRAAAGAPVELQAVAEVREAHPRDAVRSTRARRGRCARAGRRCCRSGIVEVRGRFDAGDAVEVRGPDDGRDRQGDLQLLGGRAAPRDGPEVRRRCARCCRARPRRRSTATTSCSPRPSLGAWPSQTRHPSPSICLAAQARVARRSRTLEHRRAKDARAARDRRRAGGARPTRSSRPTRATSRPGARAGSPTR